MIERRAFNRSAALLLAVLALGSAALAQVSVEHAQGRTEVPLNPEVVFSYDFAAIDTLTALGIEVDGAPPLAGAQPSWLPGGLENIGTLFEPDYEAVNAARPDLIIVAGRSAPAYSELARMAPTIDLTFGDDLLGSLAENTNTLAAIFDRQAEADAALAAIDAKVEDLRAKVAEGGDGLLIMVSGGSVTVLSPAIEQAGRGSLLYQSLGLQPTIGDVETATHGEPVSFEFLLEYDPQWLFVIDRDAAIGAEEGGQPAAQVLDNELMHQTSAWQNDRIVYVDPFNWYIITGAGLHSANAMLDEIAAAYAD